MQVLSPAEATAGRRRDTALTVGFFDGVHLGHRAVLAQVRQRAADLGVPSAVVTFDRHPAVVVRPESAPLLLTDLEQRLELLGESGIDLAVVVTFDQARAKERAEDFVTEVLVEQMGARAVVVGSDFHFGHRRRGNVSLLEAMGREHGFEVHGLELAEAPGAEGATSSTAIRRALGRGDLAAAVAMLGRPHEVRGRVERGDGRGRQLGFPTANVAVPEGICLPAEGIYAGRHVRPGGEAYAAAISLGRRRTFHAETAPAVLESHLLDFDGDLAGEAARVRFDARIRGDERFDSAEALVAQMGRDVAAAREVVGSRP